MSQFTLLYGARQVLTLRGSDGARRGAALQDLGIVENGSVLIQDGVIFALGPTRRIENLKQAREAMTLDVSGSIIMPGLIDPHFQLTYGSAPVSGASGSNRTRRSAQVYEDGVTLLRSCLQHGTLGAVLKASAERDDFGPDVTLMRLIARIGSSSVDVVRTWRVARTPESAVDTEDLHHTLATLTKRRLVDSVSFSSQTAVSMHFEPCLSQLQQARIPLHCHWSGDTPETFDAFLKQVQPWAVTCSTTIPEAASRAVAASPAVTVFAPGTEMGGTMGDAMRTVIEAGGALALSSGYHPVDAPGYSMQMAMSLAIMQGKLTTEEAITAATVNAAWAAGRGRVCGSIERGKRADLLVMTVSDYRDIARQFGINHVGTVLREGNIAFNRTRRKIMTA